MKYRNILSFIILAATLLVSVGAKGQVHERSTNLPMVYLNTLDGSGIWSKTEYKLAKMHYVYEDDSIAVYDSVSVRGRGNSTWNMSKKPYRIKFQEKEKLLGKGYAKAKSWTLLANAGDKTLIRNAVTSAMGDFLGLKFNPAHKFVDLTLNGAYMGNYQISDHVEVRPHRVNIEEQDFPLTDDSDITGGYLMEVDGFKDGNCFTTSLFSVPIRVHYPDEDEIAWEQNLYIRNYMREFESVLGSSDFADPVKGYRAWVDSVSLVNWFIATEVSANIDGYYSTYFYKNKQDSLLYWGPLWDYDIAYGNDSRIRGTERSLMTDVGYGQTKEWVKRMWEDPWFAKLVNRRYKEVIDGGLVEHMHETIDSLATLLDDSQQKNYAKWGINKKMYHEIVLYSSYEQYILDLKSFINTHTEYLKQAFANKQPAEPTPPFEAGNFYYRITNAGNAKALDMSGTVNGSTVYIWDNMSSRMTEQWKIVKEGDYFMLINREAGLALNDPTTGACTETTNTGTQLNAVVLDKNSDRQLWSIVPQGSSGYYNLTNKHTLHTANLSGGNTANGTAVLSYNTDSRNSTSKNRLWYIIADEEMENLDEGDDDDDNDNGDDDGDDDGDDNDDNDDNDILEDEEIDTGIGGMIAKNSEPEEYALAYNQDLKELHFGSATPEKLKFTVSIYSLSGQKVGQFRADERFNTASLPANTYIISWSCGGKKRSVKALLR